jgi:hypothetical protein
LGAQISDFKRSQSTQNRCSSVKSAKIRCRCDVFNQVNKLNHTINRQPLRVDYRAVRHCISVEKIMFSYFCPVRGYIFSYTKENMPDATDM